MADTAWEMIHLSSEAELGSYFSIRAKQGFNTVFTVAIAELDGFEMPNAAGHTPFAGTDLSKPNEAYWDYVDTVVRQAATYGLYVAMLPTWGTWVDQGTIHQGNAYTYGAWIGERYVGCRNLIWILGGDLDFRGMHGEHGAIFRAMAEGIRSRDTNHLIGYHPKSRSAAFAHAEAWLDFNLLQTSHHRIDNPDSCLWIEADRARTPPKPTLDGEPRYEGHFIDWKEEVGVFRAFDVRQAAYWSVLSGAAGHVYGHISVIAWKNPKLSRLPWYLPSSVPDWREGLHAPGAEDMGHLVELMHSVDFPSLTPDQSIITSNNPADGGHQRAARGDGFVIVYSPYGRGFEASLASLQGSGCQCLWVDPRSGAKHDLGERQTGVLRFDPPGGEARGNDWVLVAKRSRRRPG
jgi:hypothetical protein